MVFRNLLMAQQKVRIFTVTFDSAGGNSLVPQTVKQGKKAVFVTPDRTGYRFTGWYLDGNPYDFDTPVIQDITLVATWTRELFTQSGTAPIVPLGQKADRVDY